jgi:hypothetical protein
MGALANRLRSKTMLVLHIGTGKAGSTTIQSFLHHRSSNFSFSRLDAFGAANAWKIAATSGTARSKWYWVDHIAQLNRDEFAALQNGFWKEVEAEYLACGGTVVASSEFIYGQFEDDREAIERLHSHLLRIFGGVKLIVYLREQVSFVKSLYAQRVKGPTRETMPFEQYVNRLEELKIPIDYAARIKLWGQVFGWDNLSACMFDKRNFHNSSLIDDFLFRAGFDGENSGNNSFDASRNVSPSPKELEAMRLMNRIGIKNHRVRRVGVGAMKVLYPDIDFSNAWDSEIVEKVSAGNEWLNENLLAHNSIKLPVGSV